MQHSVEGNHVWLNAPLEDLRGLVDHYLTQKALSPHDTSACILVPKRVGPKLHPGMQGMRLLLEFSRGHKLFRGPDGKRLAGLPTQFQVWYDPPCIQLNSVPSAASQLAMHWKCRISGVKAQVLLDTGADGQKPYVSKEFCRLNNISIKPLTDVPSTTSVDGSSLKVHGTASLYLHLQKYADRVTCFVMDMVGGADLILGNQWLVAHEAVLDMKHKCCQLRHRGKLITLRHESGLTPQKFGDSVVLSAVQARRSLRQGAGATLVVVNAVAETPAAPIVEPLPDEGLEKLLEEFQDVFKTELPGLPPERPVPITIPLEPGRKPPSRPMFRYSPRELGEIQKQVQDLLSKGLIAPSSSPFGAPVLFVTKKDGTLRMVVDYRELNKITIRNQFPIPRVDDLLDRLHGAKVFSSLDLLSGYHRVRLRPEDQPKTAFRTPLGLFEFKVLPFGLTNAVSVFSSVMNDVFKDMVGRNVLIYLDDILVYSQTPEEHLVHLRAVLERLRVHHLSAKLSKCDFNKPEVHFLGHVVSAEGVHVDPRKTQVVRDWPTPRTPKDVRSFLGLANYFRRFVMGYSKLVAPLH